MILFDLALLYKETLLDKLYAIHTEVVEYDIDSDEAKSIIKKLNNKIKI